MHEQNYMLRIMADNPLLQDNDGVSNLLLGGAGSDILEGRFGDDFIDGDRVLRVSLLHVPTGTRYASAADMKNAVFAGEINPGDIEIIREIVMDGTPDDVDTAVFQDPFLNDAGEPNYVINPLPDGYWEIMHVGGPEFEESEGADILVNIERVVFGDGGCFELSEEFTPCPTLGSVTFSGQTNPPTEDQAITATVVFEDEDGNPTVVNPRSIRFNWQAGEVGEAWDPSPTEGGPVTKVAGRNAWTQTFTPGDGDAGAIIRVVVTFQDDDGVLRQVVSPVVGSEDGTDPSELSVVNINDAPYGLTLSNMTPRVGQSVVASPFVDPDGLEEAVEAGMTYTWQTSSNADFSGDVVPVAVKVTPDTNQLGYTIQPADQGRYLRVVIEYTDDQGTEETYVSPVTAAILPAEAFGP